MKTTIAIFLATFLTGCVAPHIEWPTVPDEPIPVAKERLAVGVPGAAVELELIPTLAWNPVAYALTNIQPGYDAATKTWPAATNLTPLPVFYEVAIRSNGQYVILGATNGTSFPIPTPSTPTEFSVRSAGTNSLTSAWVTPGVWWPPLPITNVFTFASSVPQWTPVKWTNPPAPPPGLSMFFRVEYLSNNRARIQASPNPTGPWAVWTNWPMVTTTNKAIGLSFRITNL